MKPLAALAAVLLVGCSAMGPRADNATLKQQVIETERAFAATRAARDHARFTSFLADDTVFFSGPQPLRGKAAVAAHWKRFYEKAAAPFSWEPAEVEVLESGTLALSSGPVKDPSGKPIGAFTSIWRREGGQWRIVFDKGCDPCACEKSR